MIVTTTATGISAAISLILAALAGIFALGRQDVKAHNAEQAIADLTYKVRHPWKAKLRLR